MKQELAAAVRAVRDDMILAVRRPILKRRLRRAWNPTTAPVKVSIGAGAVKIPGWLCTDVVWWGDMYLDLTKPWPGPAETVDFIYGDNVIEHFPLHVAREVLSHAFDA